MCKVGKCHVDCENILRAIGLFEWRREEDFLSECHGGVRFAFRLCFLVRIFLNHESITSASEAYINYDDELPNWNGVVSVLIHTRCWLLFLLHWIYLSALMWVWLLSLIWAIYRKVLAFQPTWKDNFCNSSRNPGSAVMPFLNWGIWNCLENCGFSEHLVSSTCLTLKWHLSIVSFNPAWQLHLKTAGKFQESSKALLAAISMSPMFWEQWSALTTGCKYSRVKLEKADTDLLRLCASLL